MAPATADHCTANDAASARTLMAFDLITVAVFAPPTPGYGQRLRLTGVPPTFAEGFDVHEFATDDDLARVLVEVRPQVLVTFGKPEAFRRLFAAPLEIRKRWVHVDDPSADAAHVARSVLECYVANATTDRFPAQPLVSVFTPTYKTGERIARPLRSLLGQSYTNWEWVLYDDSPDGGETFERLVGLTRQDHRIAAYRADRPCGVIGEVKRRACGLCRGALLVELDHDDELTPDALETLVAAAARFPEAGFFYSDCAETFEDGTPAVYGEGGGMGFGSYRAELHNGVTRTVTNYPPVNALTIRHIVGVPNHYRAWRRDVYHALGGHGPDVHVCDDYELLVRTFLRTRMCHVKRLGYVQYHNGKPGQETANTQRSRNKEIQRLTDAFMLRYNDQIHARLLELGAEDWIWRQDASGRAWLQWDAARPRGLKPANLEFP